MQDNAPYNPQAHFYSDPYEKYLRWQQKKENVLKYVKKTLKWVFIIAVPLCFLVLFIWALFTNHNNVYPVKTSSGVLGGYGIFTPLIHALQDFFWLFVMLFGLLCYWVGFIFSKIGGSDLLGLLISNSGTKYWIGILTGAALVFFVIMLIVRAIKIANNKDADEGYAMAKSTPGIIFWAITSLVIIPVIWLFVTSVVLQLINVIVSGGNIAVALFQAAWKQGPPPGYGLDTWSGIENATGSWLMDAANHSGYDFNVFICLVAWIGGTLCAGAYAWRALSLIINLVLCYILMFPAIGKWPQDEGGSAEAIRTEITGNFINLFFLYFFFTIVSILIGAINGLSTVLGLGGFGNGIFQILFIIVACFQTFKFTSEAAGFFQAKNKVNYTTFSESGGDKIKEKFGEKNALRKENKMNAKKEAQEAKAAGFSSTADYKDAQASAQLRAGNKLKSEHNLDKLSANLSTKGVNPNKARIMAKGMLDSPSAKVSHSILKKQAGVIK